MKKIKMVALFLLVCALCACHDYSDGHQLITFVNNTDKMIACQKLWQITITPADTLFRERGIVISIRPDSFFNFNSLNEV